VPIDNAVLPNYGLVWDSQAAKISGNMDAGWTTISANAWTPSCFTKFRFNDGSDSLLFGDNRDVTLVFNAFGADSDDGEPITITIDGPMHVDDNVRQVIWGPLYLVMDSDDATRAYISGSVNGKVFSQIATIDIDQGGGVNLPVDLPFDFGIKEAKTRSLINPKKLGRGNTFQIRIVHNDAGKTFTFNEYTIYAVQKGAR
jgi:hypothetical protein